LSHVDSSRGRLTRSASAARSIVERQSDSVASADGSRSTPYQCGQSCSAVAASRSRTSAMSVGRSGSSSQMHTAIRCCMAAAHASTSSRARVSGTFVQVTRRTSPGAAAEIRSPSSTSGLPALFGPHRLAVRAATNKGRGTTRSERLSVKRAGAAREDDLCPCWFTRGSLDPVAGGRYPWQCRSRITGWSDDGERRPD
jgi:hypothetical protein